jgi:hypothetical protein
MTYWFLVVRQISAGVMEGESNKCGGIQRAFGVRRSAFGVRRSAFSVRRPVEVEWGEGDWWGDGVAALV